jgi:hypothetical protein
MSILIAPGGFPDSVIAPSAYDSMILEVAPQGISGVNDSTSVLMRIWDSPNGQPRRGFSLLSYPYIAILDLNSLFKSQSFSSSDFLLKD